MSTIKYHDVVHRKKNYTKELNILMYASYMGYFHTVKNIINYTNINISEIASKGVNAWNKPTALILATRTGHSDIAKILIESGESQPSICDRDGISPLMYAIRNDMYDIVRLLLETGESIPNHRDYDIGASALDIAVGRNNIDVIKLLFNHVYYSIEEINEALNMYDENNIKKCLCSDDQSNKDQIIALLNLYMNNMDKVN